MPLPLAGLVKDFLLVLLAASLLLALTIQRIPGEPEIYPVIRCPNCRACPPPVNCSSSSPSPPYTLVTPIPDSPPPDSLRNFGHPISQYTGKPKGQFGQDSYFLQVSLPIYNGYFIEFGCANGIENSNTYHFEKAYNWTGLCIEPNPLTYLKAKAARPNSIVLNVGIADQAAQMEYWYLTDSQGRAVADQLSGIGQFYSASHLKLIRENVKKGHTLQKRNISVLPLAELQQRYFAPGSVVDLLSMDCEGCEWAALRGINWSHNRFSFLTFELSGRTREQRAEMFQLLTDRQYHLQPETATSDNPIFLSRPPRGFRPPRPVGTTAHPLSRQPNNRPTSPEST